MTKMKNTWEIPEIKDDYLIENFRPLTIKERSEIYTRLTKEQRKLIDEHRKFLIRSEFLKDSYLKASDWEFVDLKIDDDYPKIHHKHQMLYCECGRRLKYQYVVKSKETQKVMCLGIQHFKDHLNIPQQVATEIAQRLNNVDFALDELLWLKRLGIDFPDDLWENYIFFMFGNQFVSSEIRINLSLARRVADFKEAKMPIYLADYKEVLSEIEKYRVAPEKINNDVYNKENFQAFKTSFKALINQETLFNQASVWSSSIQKRLKTHPEKPHLPENYFAEIYEILKKDNKRRERELQQFANRGMGKWIQKEVYDHLLHTVREFGLGETFFSQIHPFMREGLSNYYSKCVLEEEEKVQSTSLEIAQLLDNFDDVTKKIILEKVSKGLL